MNQPGAKGSHASQTSLAEERRRSQRVVISIPVTLYCTAEAGKFTARANTVSVNTHGAMLLSVRTFAAEEKMEMQNDRTREKQQCRVTRTPTKNAQGYLVPVEFAAAAPDFWRISFPPTNWKPTEE